MKVRWLMGVTEGQRVLVTRDLDFLPFFTLKKGSSGVVQFVNLERGACSVLIDELVEGCMDNEVFFNVKSAEFPYPYWYTLEEECWPMPKES